MLVLLYGLISFFWFAMFCCYVYYVFYRDEHNNIFALIASGMQLPWSTKCWRNIQAPSGPWALYPTVPRMMVHSKGIGRREMRCVAE